MPRPREAAPDAGTRGLWAEYMVWRGGARPGLEPPQRPLPLCPPPAPRPPPLGPGGSWRPSPHAPPTAPLGLPTRGSLPGAPAHSAACLPPPGGRGRSERAGPAPPPGARGGRHGARGTEAIGAAPSLSLLPRQAWRAGQAGRGARARGRPPPFPAPWLARSLPPSLAAPAGNGSGPARPGCRHRRLAFLSPRPAALSAGSTASPERTDGPACVRPCAPSEPRAEPPLPPRPATTTRSPPPAALPPALSPLPPRPSAQARPPAREPIGYRRRARVRPRRARPHWPPRGNVSHMQMRAGRGGLRLALSRPGAGPREEGGKASALQ